MTGALWATISGFGFGVFQAFNRRGGRSFDPYVATFILLAGSAVVLAIASILTEDLRQFNGVPVIAYINFGLAGIFHFFIGWTFLTISQNKVGAARTGALIGTTPLFAIFISALAFKEYLRIPILGGIFMLIFGVYLVSFAEKPGGYLDKITWRNSLYGLGTALCFSISPIFIRNGFKQLPSPLLGVTVGMAFSAFAYGVILILRRDHIEQGAITGDALIFQLAATLFVGLSTWTRWIALDLAPVGVVLALGRLNVPTVILLSPLLVGKAQEDVTIRVWLGAALIVAGSIVLNFF